MRRRLMQLLVVLVTVGAVIGTPAPAEAGWCVNWYSCEPVGSCDDAYDYVGYRMCCNWMGGVRVGALVNRGMLLTPSLPLHVD